MPASPLTAALMAGGGNEGMMAMDPAVMAAQPDLQLAQAMLQGGLSTAPASPWQALGRIAQAAAGGYIQRGAISDLAKAYSGSADAMTQIFPAGTPIGDALRSSNPMVRAAALQQAPKAMLLGTEPYTLQPGGQRFTGAAPVTQSTAPQSQIGKAAYDANRANATGNPAAVQAIERGITKETSQPETGVQFPPTPVTPPTAAAPRPTGTGVTQSAGVQPPQPAGSILPFPPGTSPPQITSGGPETVNKDLSRLPSGAPSMPAQIGVAKGNIAANEAAMEEYQKVSTPNFNSSQNLLQRMAVIDHNIDTLGPSWMGAGADTKGELGKAWNSTMDTMGVQGAHVDPTKIASWEDFNKETTRAGMELIKSNFGGSREAASIIQMGRTAVPSVQNTYLGAKYVSATIKAAAQREIDLHNYKTGLIRQGQSLVGADADFSKTHPPEQYAMGAITSQIPPQAVTTLKSQPKTLDAFDKHFGPGTGEFILGQQQQPNGG